MIVTCGECGKKVEIEPENVIERKVPGYGLRETYFICPHCETEFPVCITNRECRMLQVQIRNTDTQFREPLQKKLRKMMNELNGKGER